MDVSDDGEYIATAIQLPDPETPYAMLLDKEGSLIWEFTPPRQPEPPYPQPTEVKISHNNQYYAVGCGEGSFYLLDLDTKEVLWKSFTEGQIRYIEFEEDDSRIYVSSGDGYLYAFNIDGSLAWKSHVYSWTIDMDVSENFIFTGAKVGRFVSLLDKQSGEVLWRYPVDAVPDQVLIAPDESFFYISISSGYSTMGGGFFDREGNLLFVLDNANAAAASTDGKYMVLSGRAEIPPEKGFWGEDVGRPFVKLINTRGHTMWSIELDDPTKHHPVHQAYAWISEDKKNIVVANFEYVYFFEGGISKIASSGE